MAATQYSKIVGCGAALPEKVVTNSDLEEKLDTTNEWIMQRVGIRERRIVTQETTTSLASAAAKEAIKRSGLKTNDIDLIIVATATSEYCFPSVACFVQRDLAITNQCPAFDVSAACAGFIYAMSIAEQYIKGGTAENVLVVGVETLSKYVDWNDRSTCILFGDGAGAVVLQKSDRPGVLATQLHALGEHTDLLYTKNSHWTPGVQQPLQMSGGDVFKFAVSKLNDIVDETLALAGMDRSQVDWLIPHQANMRIIQAIAKRLQLPLEQVILTIEEHGNTSAASVPLALYVALESGKVSRGDTLMLEAFGAGLTWGAVLLVY